MRQLLRLLVVLLAWAALLRPSSAQAQAGTAFSCDGTFYQVRQVGTGNTAYSALYTVTRNTASYSTTPYTFGGSSTTGSLATVVNALAYNSQDSYLYALTYPYDNTTLNANTGIHLYRIGQGGIQDLGRTDLPLLAYATGTIDKDGNYYVSPRGTNASTDNTLYRLNLADFTTVLTTHTEIPVRNASNQTVLTSSVYPRDLGYNPSDGNLYGVGFTNQAFKYVLNAARTQATITLLGTASSTTDVLGSAFFDVVGNFYAYSNGTVGTANSGGFYSVSTTDGTMTLISSIDPVANSDGASCINPDQRVDVVKQLTSVTATGTARQFNVRFAVRVKNTGTATDTNVQLTDFLTGNTNNTTFPTASSVTLVANSGSVTNYAINGGAVPTLAFNTAFTGQGTNADLLTGDQSLTAGQSALVEFTVTVTFPATPGTPTGVNLNSVYASTISGTTANQGHIQLTNGNILPPGNLLAADQSTDTAALPSTPNSDTPSGTPVRFTPTIEGNVFEDINYGGGLGRSQATSNGAGVAGTRVELYSYNTTTQATSFLATTTTDADGHYVFTNVSSSTSYRVRVVNNTVVSNRTGSANTLLPVQTYVNGDANRVGGEAPNLVDYGNITTGSLPANTTANAIESVTTVTTPASGPSTGVDFGYNFDTVVNTNDAGQGSLRQFIINSNTLTDESNLAPVYTATNGTTTALALATETSIFMISNGTAVAGLRAGLTNQLTNGVAIITPLAATSATGLPAITDDNTNLDGTTQTRALGNPNNTTLGVGGTVGTGSTPLAQLNGPEVQLNGSTAVSFGLDIASTATNTLVRGLAINGFGNAVDSNNGANIRSAANGVSITQNVVGATATSFGQPATLTNADDIRLIAGTSGIVISNNLIGYSNSKGITVFPGVNAVSVTGNEIRGNGMAASGYEGIDIQGSGATVTANLFTGNSGQGIDSYRSGGSNTISGNTVTDNGRGTTSIAPSETPGLRIYGSGNTITQNVISNNYGAGIMLEGATNNGSIAAVATTTMSQNSIFGNGSVAGRQTTNPAAASGQVGIDLEATGNDELKGTSPYVTLNSATTTGANGLLNYPILTSATVVGTNLLVQGYAKAGAAIELFIAQANTGTANPTGNNFGQGKTYLTTVTEGSSSDTNPSTGQSYSGNINGFNQGSDTNANGFSFLIPLGSTSLPAGTALTATATLNNATSEFSGNVATTVTAPLTGYVYEDVNYGGGLGRARSAAATVVQAGAKVELYDNTGAYIGTSITDATGQYSFSVVPGSYTVRVVNNSVLSSRQGTTGYTGSATAGYTNSLLPVQTYNGSTDRVGGENPKYVDALANSGSQTLASLSSGTVTPESIAAVTVTQAAATNAGADFGFNFDTVVNTNDVASSGNATQGTLRQFITNANALGTRTNLNQVYTATNGTTTALPTSVETSIFMIPNGLAVAGQRAGLTSGFSTPNNGVGAGGAAASAATITLATSALPTLTGQNTAIDGTTQTRSTGDSNLPTLTAGAESTGPEVLINLNNLNGLNISGTSDRLIGMGVYNSLPASVGVAISGTPTGLYFQNNTINNNGAGLSFASGTRAVEISGNVLRDAVRATADGIELNGANSATNANETTKLLITNNQILRNAGYGIDFIGSSSYVTISNNNISGNGTVAGSASQLGGIGLRGSTTSNVTISTNTFLNNNGAGIVAKAGTTGDIFTQNSFSGNGVKSATGLGLGIDLAATQPTNGNYDNGDGVTINDTNDADANPATSGANGLINFPILQKAVLNADNTVTLTGFARPGVVVELYQAADDPTHFGEGSLYLTSFTQRTTAGTTGTLTTGTAATYGTAATTGTTINGLNQGTDLTLPFTFTFTPTAAQLAALATTPLLTSTSTLTTADANNNFGTSEFSGNVRVQTPPLPNDLTNAAVASNQLTAVTLNPGVSATAYGNTTDVTTTTANTIATYTVNPITTGGTLYYNNTPVTAATTITAANKGLLSFVPTLGFTGNATFTYTATDANGLASTSHNTSAGTTASGAATYTIPVTAAADVTTTITGPSTLNAGQPSGTYTATFTNNGPQLANAVSQTVSLPTGATLSTDQANDLTTRYPGTTTSAAGSVTTITFPVSTTLPAGSSVVRTFAFTAPTATTTTATISSNVGTSGTPSQGANTAPDVASQTLSVVGVADVATTISASATSVAPGATSTLTAAFSNVAATGPQSATTVVGKVQLPIGLSNVTTSAGTYDATTGIITYTIGTLTSGQAATSLTITYTQPANGPVTATSSVSTASNEAGQVANNTNSVTVAPAQTYNVATTISGPNTATVGAQVTYNVTTSNTSTTGNSTNTNVVQTVTLPSGATNIYVTGGGTVSGTTVTFPAIAALAAGQAVNNTVSFSAPSANPFSVTANVTSTQDNATTGDNTASTSTATTAATDGSANLYTKISVTTPATNGNNVTAGTPVTFTVTEGNYGPNLAASVSNRVALPTGLIVGGATTLKLNGFAPSSISGNVATYTVDGSANGTTLGTYNTGTGNVTFATISSQNSGATPVSYALTFNAPASGVVTATSTVTSTTPDVMMGNNVASAELTVDPAATDLATTLTGPDQASTGQRVTYTATTINNGPAAASGISQVVAIPAGLPTAGTTAVYLNGAAPTSVAGTVATYAAGTYDSSTGLVTFTTTTAAQVAGGAVANTVAYNVPANGNASVVNTARVSMASNDPVPTNNVAAVVTTIQPSADVQVALTGPSAVVPVSSTQGAPVTYGVTTTNNGPSTAGSVATTVQLPTGLTGVVVIGYDGTTLTNSTTTGYNSADGIVRFPAVVAQPSGAAYASTGSISLTTPTNVNILTPTAMAVLTSTTGYPATEPNLTNNSATVATTISAPTTASVDLSVTLGRSAATVTAGTQVVFTVTTTNALTSTAAASAGAITTVQLPAGLTTTGTVTLTNNGTYDNATGLVTFTTTGTLAAGNNVANTITISQAPGAGPVVATAAVRGNESDPTPANNSASTSVAITAAVDVATTVTGSAASTLGGPVTYTVTTANNGPSTATGVAQTVTLPAGIISYSINGGTAVQVNGGNASTGTTQVTLTVPATIAAGPANTVANTITFNAPASATNFQYTVTANVSATNETGPTTNNSAAATTTRYVQPPVATNVTNTLTSPEGNTATAALPISPLAATSATSTIGSYKLSSIAPTSQGVLYYNNGGTYTAITSTNYAGLTLTPTQAGSLRFLPASSFVGNASFTYTAIDNTNSLVSNVATYLIPVGLDNASTSAYTPAKGSTNVYNKNDVLAYITDTNGTQYTANAGTTPGIVYDATTGALQSGAANGLTSAALAATGPSGNTANTLPAGTDLNTATGQIYVTDPTLLPRIGATYTVNVTTVDVNGGTNTTTVTFVLGSYPLPVELKEFTAQAVQNRDALLNWVTASELNSAYFDVERSLDGKVFAKIGQVAAQGNKATATSYTLTDTGIGPRATGQVYYRLRQVDQDGTATFSPVRIISFTKAATAALTLYPNPAQTYTNLDLSTLPATATYQALLLDATGREVLAATLAGGAPQKLDLTGLATGTYQVLVTGTLPDGSALRQVLRLTKE